MTTPGRTTSITDKNPGGTTIDSYDYTYNTAGLVATVTSTLAPSATYTYDPDGQLLSDGTNSYTYDPDGNRTDSGYATTTGNELTTDGTWDYTYDAAGNMTEKVNISTGVVWLYSYNNANELVQVQEKPSSGGSVDYRGELHLRRAGQPDRGYGVPDGIGIVHRDAARLRPARQQLG